MKDPNFTPGKWMVCEDDFGEFFVENESGDPVCEVCGTTDDAHLIAAAPEMYEALGELADQAYSLLTELDYQKVSCPLCGEDPGDGDDALCGVVKALADASGKARALIARLKGET